MKEEVLSSAAAGKARRLARSFGGSACARLKGSDFVGFGVSLLGARGN